MQLTIKASKTKKITNQFKLVLTFMQGDADQFRVGIKYSSDFEGELEELYKLYQMQIEKTKNGIGMDDALKLFSQTKQLVVTNSVLNPIAVKDQSKSDEQATDYLLDLGDGGDDESFYSPYAVELKYLNRHGEECDVEVTES
jgi:hypothetical protein